MKILWKGFAANNHSWSFVAQNICRGLIKLNHNVDIFSTNGNKHFPEDLLNNLKGVTELNANSSMLANKVLDSKYDAQFTYTAMINFQEHLSRGDKNRIGLWTYEFSGKNVLPFGFAKHYKYTDIMTPPSEYSKQIFIDSGVPESHMKVIPHGVDLEKLENIEGYHFKTKKSVKILSIIGQPHLRKNLPGLLEVYGKAFNKTDDVCLILKIVDKKPEHLFEVSFSKIFNDFKAKYKNHADVEIISNFINHPESLYKNCDISFSMTHCEAFGMTLLEGLAANNIVIAPNHGGQLQFLNELNSLLVSGKEETAPSLARYWDGNYSSNWFKPDINDAVDKLKYAVENVAVLKQRFYNLYNLKKYDWLEISKTFEGLLK